MMLALRLLDTHIGLILVYVGMTAPFNLWIMKGAIDSVPLELEEAAQIDGASRLKILRTVVLPLIFPGLGTVGVLSFVAAWGGFILPLVLLSSGDKYPVSVGIFSAFGLDDEVDFAQLATMCIVYMLPVIILYLTVGNYFRKGLASIGAGDR
jgi:multiple sugar transport system permease protein